MREVRIVVDIGGDGAATVEEFRGVARHGVFVSRVGGYGAVLEQALHADGCVDGYRQFEFVGAEVVVWVHADGQCGVGASGRFVLADHQRSCFCGAEPVHVAYVVSRFVFAQSVEVEVVIDDFAAGLTFEVSRNSGVECVQHDGLRVDEHVDLVDEFLFVPYESEWVAFAYGKGPDRQHRAGDGGEFHGCLA